MKGKNFNSRNGKITCSDYCYSENIKRNQDKQDLIRKGTLEREKRKCLVCGKCFICNKYNRVYCSKKCREDATKKRRLDYFNCYYKENKEKKISNVKKRKKNK
ncbi:hypothetical protein [Thomasclavelia cocleata]|uniref:hypothetical protein n=1 Tax=Thomasclavelia cocleata TaxID=69824 RepID=UPI00272E7821|nr:hypothetical protein [Thomasclavelia cocleata]